MQFAVISPEDSMAVMTYISAIGMKAIISKSNPYLNGIGMLIDS